MVQSINADMSINLEGSVERVSKEDDLNNSKEVNNIYSVGADLYVLPQLSIGGGFKYNTGDDTVFEGNTYTVRTKGYFAPNVALGVSYEKFKAKDSNQSDEDLFEIALTGRL